MAKHNFRSSRYIQENAYVGTKYVAPPTPIPIQVGLIISDRFPSLYTVPFPRNCSLIWVDIRQKGLSYFHSRTWIPCASWAGYILNSTCTVSLLAVPVNFNNNSSPVYRQYYCNYPQNLLDSTCKTLCKQTVSCVIISTISTFAWIELLKILNLATLIPKQLSNIFLLWIITYGWRCSFLHWYFFPG